MVGTARRSTARHAGRSLAGVPAGAKVLWVASSGGHLTEVAVLARQLDASPTSLWVTSATPQSEELLRGRRHLFVDHVGPRDLRGALRAAARVAPVLRRERFDLCVSSGAAVAATVLPLAALAGTPTYYVESLARVDGPSLTGRLLQHVPGVRTLTQHPAWASPRWPCHPGTLDGWTVRQSAPHRGPLRILVTLGTVREYRFDRAVDAVLRVLRPGDEVTWQLHGTSRTDLPGEVLPEVSPSRLAAAVAEADVVVAHAGVGSVLQLLELGRSPVLVVRERRHGEHVDDHQRQLARTSGARGLTSVLDLADPRRAVLEEAAARLVRRSTATGPVVTGP